MLNRRQFIQSASILTVPAFAWSAKEPVLNPDVAIIGSGPAGLSLATYLSEAGVKVLVIESGPLNGYDTKAQERNKVLDAGKGLPYELGWATKRMVGGTSNVWGGHSPRFQPDDLICKSKFAYAADWPITYKELEHYYCEAERSLQVFNYQNSCSPYTLKDSSFELSDHLKSLGLKKAVPASVTVNKEGAYQALRLKHSHLPSLIKNKNFSILQNVSARNFEMDKSGLLKSIICSTNDHTELKVNCKKVVICAGAIQSARLLMLLNKKHSTLEIGSAGGHLAANFMDHPAVRMTIIETGKQIKKAPPPLIAKPPFGQAHIWDWYGQYRNEGIGAYLPLVAQRESMNPITKETRYEFGAICEQEPLQENRFELSKTDKDEFGDALPKFWYKVSDFDKKTFQHASLKMREFLDKNENLKLKEEKDIRLGSHHLMGTTKMAKKDKDGVVDTNLRVFGSKNIYVLGGSVFPSGGAANPTLTIVALAKRLSEHLLKANS